MMKISIIGAGKAAWFMAERLRQSALPIYQVHNRTEDRGRKLAETYGAEHKADIQNLAVDVDAIIFAITESHIAELTSTIALVPSCLHISLSGSMDIAPLPVASSWSVMWPIYSLVSGAEMKSDIPMVLQVPTDEERLETSHIIADAISQNQYLLTEKKRMVAHLSAVFANNFVNFLNKEMFTIMKEHQLDTSMILDIMASTLENSTVKQELSEITGPAARRDDDTIEQHLHILSEDTVLQNLYSSITQSIIEKTQA